MELFELEGICRFVADFVAFEPLADLVQPPARLASPASVLAWQARAEHSDIAEGVRAIFRVLNPEPSRVLRFMPARWCIQGHGSELSRQGKLPCRSPKTASLVCLAHAYTVQQLAV